MKTTFQLSILAVLGLSVAAFAAPTVGPMGPSAKMAAKLKKNPSPSWLAHYLPDDRYKIAGGVWKYVSTDLDTYVHLPNSPLMLRQSADSVIGFASIADAEEAGYTPEPGLSAASDFGGISAPSSVVYKTSQTVTAADGKSTIVLPAGWQKLKSTSSSLGAYGTMTMDIFRGPRAQGLQLMTMTLAPNLNVNLDHVYTVEGMKNLTGQMNSLGKSFRILTQRSADPHERMLRDFTSQMEATNKHLTSSAVTLGGIEGVSLHSDQAATSGQPAPVFLFGKGQRSWIVAGKGNDVTKILKTFTPR